MRSGLNFANSICCKSIEAIAAFIYHGFDDLAVHDEVNSFAYTFLRTILLLIKAVESQRLKVQALRCR